MVVEEPKNSEKKKKSKDDDNDAAARADDETDTVKPCKGKSCDEDGTTVVEEEEESGKGKKSKGEETEARAEGDVQTEGDADIVVEECQGKKCNKKNSAKVKDKGEEIVAVVPDGEGGEEIVACKGKSCKGEIANVAEVVAEAIEGSSEVKASKMKASKVSKISGDEAEVSIPIFIAGFTR
jgi:hypothetical protein